MATSIEQVRGFLDEFDLRYRVNEEEDTILIGFNVDPDSTTFRDRDGDPHVRLVIRLVEDGEFLSFFCPWAWNVDGCPHKAAVFEAVSAIQGLYKMLRFDYDPADGEIRPNIELPIEDAEITSRQFHRLIHGVIHGVQRYDSVIRHAMQTGEVSFASVADDEPHGAPPPEIFRLQRLAAEAGGIEALERIACGCCGDERAEESTEESAPEPAQLAGNTPPMDADPPTPKPVIRRIWERLFGPGEPDSGSKRRAG